MDRLLDTAKSVATSKTSSPVPVTSSRNSPTSKSLFHALKNKRDDLFRNLSHHSDDLSDVGRNVDTHTRTGAPDGDTSFDPPAWAAEDHYLAPTREQ